MADTRYASGTIKIKNAEGRLVPFHPKTDSSAVDTMRGMPVTSVIAEVEEQITAAENSGGCDILYTNDVETDSADTRNETLLVCFPIQDDNDFVYTVDTRLYDGYSGTADSSNRYSAVPFNLYGQDEAILDVDWGDGSTSHLTSASYSSQTSISASRHYYSSPGIYTIRVKCSDWSKVSLFTMPCSYSESANRYYSFMSFLLYYRRTLVSIDSALPPFKGTRSWDNASSGTSTITQYDNSFYYAFAYCTKLQTIPPAMFSKCRYSTSFVNAFYYCSNLQSIPDSTFRNCSAAISFASCFYQCINLRSIADNAFWNCSKAETFYGCFEYCHSLTSLPRRMFYGCSSIKTMSYAFSYSGLASIPSDLFKWCGSSLLYATACFSVCYQITSAPMNLFRGCTAIEEINGLLRETGIQTLTLDLTDSPNITTAYNMLSFYDSSIYLTVYVKSGSYTHTEFTYYAGGYYDINITIIAV